MDSGGSIQARFALEARIGRGAFGDVYRAVDRTSGAVVAVKRLHQSLDEPVAAERFAREARMLARVDHPHVVRYVAHGPDDEGRACLVVEWLEGRDLAVLMRKRRLGAREAIAIAHQTALGLHALHEAGIIHRDIKPSNLFLVGEEGAPLCVKLIDLGVARAASESTITVGSFAVGTPFYMSPEQARGDDRITSRADQFSLAIVLFEMIAGRRPFTGDDMFGVLAKIVLQDPPHLRELVKDAPEPLDALLRRAMSRAAEARFDSALAMADALTRLPRWETAEAAEPIEPAGDPETLRTSLALSASSEQRVVTAVFASAGPSMPKDAGIEAFLAIAEAHGATCTPTLGRHVIAVFGGARTVGDEAMRAARAALDAAEKVPGLRLAISTGRALSGATGLAGDVIDRGAHELDGAGGYARKGEPAARPIRVDDATARLLADHFVVEERGRDRVLVGPRSVATAPRTLVGKPIACIGRDRELGALFATFTECANEPVARAVVVTGPPGIGKSRLRYELLARAARSETPPTVLFGRGSVVSAGSPFGVLGPAIRRLSGILDGEPAELQRSKLATRVGRYLTTGDAAATIAMIAELSGLRDAESGGQDDARLVGDRMRSAFVRFLDAECSAHPVMLVLEDLQWGDVPTVSFIDAALRDLEQRPLFVMGVGRNEVHERFPRLFADRGAQEVRVGPLTRRASERIVREALGDRLRSEEIELVLSRAEGNAFYLEELCRALEAGGRDALPDTVLGMVQARLDALGSAQKRILRAASVFGQTFWQGGVLALLGPSQSAESLAETLDDLVAREVVARRETAVFPGESELIFRHAVVRDAAYAMLADEDRAVGHRLAGAWLEASGELDPAVLSLHFERGGVLDRASRAALSAAEKALRGNDFLGAIAYAERSLSHDGPEEERGAARLIQAEALRWSGDMASAKDRGSEAATLLPQGTIAWFHAAREVIAASGRLGQIEDVRRFADAAMACTPSAQTAGAHLACLVPAAVHFLYVGEPEAASAVADKIEAIVAVAGALDPTVAARLHQLWAMRAQQRGDPEAALTQQKAALACFEDAGDARGACLTSSNLGFAYAELGSFSEAEDALRRAHASATRMGLSTITPLALQNLGAVLTYAGRFDEARDALIEAAETFRAQGDPRLEAASRVHLVTIHLHRGELGQAEDTAMRIIDTPGCPQPLMAAAYAALSRVLRAGGRLPEALDAAEQGAQRLERLGSIEEFEQLVRVAHAEALDASGHPEAAQAAIAEAWKRLRIGAGRLRDPALRERFLTAPPDNARCVELARAFGVPGAS